MNRQHAEPHDWVSPSRTSVVIPTRDRPALLRRCLASLGELRARPLEVIVVDNSEGNDETRLSATAAKARYVLEPVGGVARARNAGARAALGDIVAYVDDDVVVDPGWLDHVVAPFADNHVMAVTGRVLGLDSNASPVEGGWLDLGATPRRFDRSTPGWFELANFGGIGNGPTMAFRRKLFETWPGFRVSISHGSPIPGGEENYAYFELLRDGHTIVYAPEARVAHPDPPTPDAKATFRARVLAQGAAHATLLLVEHPGYRMRTLRFVARGLLRRAGIGPPPSNRWPSRLSSARVMLSVAKGPVLYAQSRWQARGDGAGVERSSRSRQ